MKGQSEEDAKEWDREGVKGENYPIGEKDAKFLECHADFEKCLNNFLDQRIGSAKKCHY